MSKEEKTISTTVVSHEDVIRAIKEYRVYPLAEKIFDELLKTGYIKQYKQNKRITQQKLGAIYVIMTILLNEDVKIKHPANPNFIIMNPEALENLVKG